MKGFLKLVIIGFILVIAAITNPTKDEFIIWAKDKMKQESNNGLVDWGIEVFGGKVLSTVTTGDDYLFFTIYDAKISDSNEIKVLGLFNHFIPLSKKANSSL